MEFLVEITLKFPPDMTAGHMQELYDREALRAAELAEAGLLKRLWRLPGQRANIGLWEAPDPTVLHEALMSWPMFMDIQVQALAVSTKDPGRNGLHAAAVLADYGSVRATANSRQLIKGQ